MASDIDVDDDTDEEVDESAVVFSDEERDVLLFDSDEDDDYSDEDNDVDENDYDSEDSESKSDKEAQKDSIKSKDVELKNKNKVKQHKNKESLTFKDKASTSREITPIIDKLKTNKSCKGLDEICKDDTDNEQETKNVSNNTNEDEYVHDTSDEEDIRNTVGNVPLKWYDEYDHVGYDWEGKKIPKPEKGDELDNFLKRMEDPDFWRTIKDPQTGRDVVLSEADIDLIVRIQKQKIPDAQFDEYAVSYIYDHLV